MNRALLLTTFFIISLPVVAQQTELDRMRQAIQDHPQPDTFRVNRLNEICTGLIRFSPAELDKYSSEAFAISKKLDYKYGVAASLLSISRAKTLNNSFAEAQMVAHTADSLIDILGDKPLKILSLLRQSGLNISTDNNRSLAYALHADSLARQLNNDSIQGRARLSVAEAYYQLSDYARAMEYGLAAQKIAAKTTSLSMLRGVANVLSNIYIAIGEYDKSTENLNKIIELNKKVGASPDQNSVVANSIGENYRLSGKYEEALKAYRKAIEIGTNLNGIETAESNIADVYLRMDSLPQAFAYGFRSMKGAIQAGDDVGVTWIDGILARAYLKKGMYDSALYYAGHGYKIAGQTGVVEYLRDNARALSDAYAKKGDYKNAHQFQTLYFNYRDSMLSAEVKNKVAVLEYNTELEKKQGEISVLSQQKKAQQNFLIAISLVLLSILITAIALLRNNRSKQKAKAKVEQAYTELKNTQAQLIQSEKMASLGELTAGIAHEIQNPLNFVNNFSEINRDLLSELDEEAARGNLAEVQSIAKNIIANEEKINHHGKRADSIVKGMLQHSRNGSGQKELTNINVLADEYLRVAYHGLRAKDKSFHAQMKTDFDSSIGKVHIVRQDIGRALLNLVANAFYAVHEKAAANGNGYSPAVDVTTKKAGDKIELKITDNGNGIPPGVIDKIFQPFFTTKPAGQGTGLGLSLTYDIVKAHGGEIKVSSEAGHGTTFTILLPAA